MSFSVETMIETLCIHGMSSNAIHFKLISTFYNSLADLQTKTNPATDHGSVPFQHAAMLCPTRNCSVTFAFYGVIGQELKHLTGRQRSTLHSDMSGKTDPKCNTEQNY
jgi:hypothetical protein